MESNRPTACTPAGSLAPLSCIVLLAAGCIGDPQEASARLDSVCSEATLACLDVTDLALGVPQRGRLGASGDKAYYRIAIETDDTLILELEGGTGRDFDLYVRKGEPPTQTVQDDWAHSATADETLTIAAATAGDYYLMVRSFSGSGDFTIEAFLASSMPDSDGDGLWDEIEPGLGLDPASDQLTGEADRLPWSGYWWPYYDGGITAPMAAYDRYMTAAHGIDPGAAAWEQSQHGDPTAEYWVGHCHAWSAAALLEPEPTTAVTRAGVTFGVAELKGLLTELHFADPVEFSVSVSKPKAFHLHLLGKLGTQRRAVVADVAPSNETWNHPLYRYSITSSIDPEDANVRHYVATLTFLSDGVDPGFVGRLEMVKTYEYRLVFRNGDIVDGAWEGDSVAHHPDFFWRPAQQRAAYGNPLDAAIVQREILGDE